MERVLDASAAISWLVPGQETDASNAFRELRNDGLIAPFHFKLEVRHAIVRFERRRIIPQMALDAALTQLESAIQFISDGAIYPINQVLMLARHHNIGIYDAVYVVLALRTGNSLVSRDGAMLVAARNLGIDTVDFR